MTCHMNLCGITVVQSVGILKVSSLHGLVVLLANQVGSVVALQLHHNLDRVAQVIDRH